jgi:hypothetical protein
MPDPIPLPTLAEIEVEIKELQRYDTVVYAVRNTYVLRLRQLAAANERERAKDELIREYEMKHKGWCEWGHIVRNEHG